MSKAVLISIRPKWCEKIVNGEKTIEVRKTKPKLETPFKCYIYCTLPKYPHEDFIATDYPRPQFYGGGKVIGEFTCDRIYEIRKRGIPIVTSRSTNGGITILKPKSKPYPRRVFQKKNLTLMGPKRRFSTAGISPTCAFMIRRAIWESFPLCAYIKPTMERAQRAGLLVHSSDSTIIRTALSTS